MNKFSVYIPFDEQRDAMVASFANNGVRYLYPMDEKISEETLPRDATDEQVQAVGDRLGEMLLRDTFSEVCDTSGVYEFEQGGVRLGWEVELYATDDEARYSSYDEDEYSPFL